MTAYFDDRPPIPQPPAHPVAWIADIRFIKALDVEKFLDEGSQSLIETVPCFIWNPNEMTPNIENDTIRT